MSLFSKEKVNTGRQPEVDFLRGMTAVTLLIIHIGLYLGREGTGLYTFCDILGSEFAAPVFMALMGLSTVYSRHQAPKDMLKRGLLLFGMGYALNAWRSLLPLLIWGPIDEWAAVETFFVVDILPFAGLSFMFLALLKKLRISDGLILVLSLAMTFLNQELMLPASVPWDSELLTGIVNLFCPVSGWSCFPFLTWFFFPAFGRVLGDLLIRCTDKKKLYAVLLPVGLAGVLYVYYRFYCLYPDYTEYYYGHNFYYMGLKNVLLNGCFVCFALAFWFFAGRILPTPVKKGLTFLSRNLNPFYVFTWIAVSLLIHLKAIYGWNPGTWTIVGMIVVSEILCAVLTWLWLFVKGRFLKKAD